jgi:hypothetical protein
MGRIDMSGMKSLFSVLDVKANRIYNAVGAGSETGEQVPARPHDSGSQANETVDGLDASTEALRYAAEDTPTGAGPGDVEKNTGV